MNVCSCPDLSMHAHGLVVFLVRELQIFPPIIEVLRQRSPAQNPQQAVGKSWALVAHEGDRVAAYSRMAVDGSGWS